MFSLFRPIHKCDIARGNLVLEMAVGSLDIAVLVILDDLCLLAE